MSAFQTRSPCAHDRRRFWRRLPLNARKWVPVPPACTRRTRRPKFDRISGRILAGAVIFHAAIAPLLFRLLSEEGSYKGMLDAVGIGWRARCSRDRSQSIGCRSTAANDTRLHSWSLFLL